ncbi:MAG TPA: hypothetical protein VLY87_00745 [Flavobacterium sp.]|nr:hypothetical protein [Flavobacterium sp.]
MFKIHRGTDKIFHYLKIDRAQIVTNTLFEIEETTKKLTIPQDGFYEIKATFHFNPNTSLIKNNRGGVNFGIVQISEENEQYVAATRKSFDKDNQMEFSTITVYPTIVYLQKDVVVAPAVSSGLIGNVLLGCEIGCEKKNKNCTSFEWEIKLISSEKAYQKYF